MHSNQLRVVRIELDELSVAESEWASESCSDDSQYSSENDVGNFLLLSDVTKLVN